MADDEFLLRRSGQLDRAHRHHERVVQRVFVVSVALAVGFAVLYARSQGARTEPATTFRGLLPWLAAASFWGLLGWTRKHLLDRAAVDEQRRAIATELAARDGEFEFESVPSVAALFPRVSEFHETELEPEETSVWVRAWEFLWLEFHARGGQFLQAYYLLLVAASVWYGLLELAPLVVP